MDFTILAVVLLLGIGIPARNKLIRKYRDKKRNRIMNGMKNEYGNNRFYPLPHLRKQDTRHTTKLEKIPFLKTFYFFALSVKERV